MPGQTPSRREFAGEAPAPAPGSRSQGLSTLPAHPSRPLPGDLVPGPRLGCPDPALQSPACPLPALSPSHLLSAHWWGPAGRGRQPRPDRGCSRQAASPPFCPHRRRPQPGPALQHRCASQPLRPGPRSPRSPRSRLRPRVYPPPAHGASAPGRGRAPSALLARLALLQGPPQRPRPCPRPRPARWGSRRPAPPPQLPLPRRQPCTAAGSGTGGPGELDHARSARRPREASAPCFTPQPGSIAPRALSPAHP